MLGAAAAIHFASVARRSFLVGARYIAPGEHAWRDPSIPQAFAFTSCGVRRLAAAVFGRGLPRPIRAVTMCINRAQASGSGYDWLDIAARPPRRTADSGGKPPHST